MDASPLSRRAFLNVLGAAPAAAPHALAANQATPQGAGSLTDAGGVRVGYFTDRRRPTGCTVILFDEPARAGVDYNGSSRAVRRAPRWRKDRCAPRRSAWLPRTWPSRKRSSRSWQ